MKGPAVALSQCAEFGLHQRKTTSDCEDGEQKEVGGMDSPFPMSQLAQRLPFLPVNFVGDV